jgi:hypothetical protein
LKMVCRGYAILVMNVVSGNLIIFVLL